MKKEEVCRCNGKDSKFTYCRVDVFQQANISHIDLLSFHYNGRGSEIVISLHGEGKNRHTNSSKL